MDGPTWSRLGRPRCDHSAASTTTTLTSRGTRSPLAAATKAGLRLITAGHQPKLYLRRDRPALPPAPRPAVLVLLRLQRLEQPARGRLGDHPARLRRRKPPRSAGEGDRPRSATASTRARSRRTGATTSSSSSTDPSGRLPGGRLPRELLRLGAVPRELGRAGRRLRQHDRSARRAAPGGRDDPERSGSGPGRVSVDRLPGPLGELQPAFFNGPTGPNLKTQWTEPITWSQGWRDGSLAVPAGSVFGTGGDRLLLPGDRQRVEGARPSCFTVHSQSPW